MAQSVRPVSGISRSLPWPYEAGGLDWLPARDSHPGPKRLDASPRGRRYDRSPDDLCSAFRTSSSPESTLSAALAVPPPARPGKGRQRCLRCRGSWREMASEVSEPTIEVPRPPSRQAAFSGSFSALRDLISPRQPPESPATSGPHPRSPPPGARLTEESRYGGEVMTHLRAVEPASLPADPYCIASTATDSRSSPEAAILDGWEDQGFSPGVLQ
jgi:hypothetical protein